MQQLDRIFRDYDIRGQVPDELTTDIARRVGTALAAWLPEDGPVAVGRDMRNDSDALATALITGLTQAGREVWDIGLVTTDMLYFTVGYFDLAGGAMVTASHNPGQYNGIKLCRDRAQPIGADSGLRDIQALTRDHPEPTSSGAAGNVVTKEVTQDWVEHVHSFVDVDHLRPLKVGIDAANGMAGATVPALFDGLPFTLTKLYFERDGSFPNHPPNPMDPDNLQQLARTIQEDDLDLGIAFDGDGDRTVVVDELGHPVSGSIMTAILAEHILRQRPGSAVVFDVRSSKVVADVVQKHEGQPVRSKVGHPFMMAEMAAHRAPFGGEASGHFYFQDNFYADSGAIAALLILEVISQSGLTLSELAAEYQQYYQSDERNYQVADKTAVIEQLSQQFSDGKQDRLDGLTVSYRDWWFNVRPSNTEPLLRLNVEATTQAALDEGCQRVESIITASKG